MFRTVNLRQAGHTRGADSLNDMTVEGKAWIKSNSEIFC
jgi:hypothetical protein